MAIEPGIELTKANVLSRISEEEIFEKYLGISVQTNVDYHNPLRLDKNAGCRFYYNSLGRLKFKDFSKGYNWDCFNIVQYKYNVSFIEALRIIVKDFNVQTIEINNPNTFTPVTKIRPEIRVCVRNWNDDDLKFWEKASLNAYDLIQSEIYPCKSVWINRDYFLCKKDDPCYCFYFGDQLYKLYFPKRKYNRFFHNTLDEDYFLQNYKKLPATGDHLIITKSYKDTRCMNKFNLNAVAPMSESILRLLNENQFRELNERFNGNIFSLFDNDVVGRKAMIQLQKEFNIPPLIFPFTMKKDFTDNVDHYGYEYTREIIIPYVREKIQKDSKNKL